MTSRRLARKIAHIAAISGPAIAAIAEEPFRRKVLIECPHGVREKDGNAAKQIRICAGADCGLRADCTRQPHQEKGVRKIWIDKSLVDGTETAENQEPAKISLEDRAAKWLENAVNAFMKLCHIGGDARAGNAEAVRKETGGKRILSFLDKIVERCYALYVPEALSLGVIWSANVAMAVKENMLMLDTVLKGLMSGNMDMKNWELYSALNRYLITPLTMAATAAVIIASYKIRKWRSHIMPPEKG